MINTLRALVSDTDFLLRMVIGLAVVVAVFSVGLGYLRDYDLRRRLRAITTERDRVRERERNRMSREKGELRFSSQGRMQSLATRLNLDKHLAQEQAKVQLLQAGYRNPSAYMGYLGIRAVAGVCFFLLALFYMLVIEELDQPGYFIVLLAILAGGAGLYLPQLLLKNKINKRQADIRRAFPDALDLILICVEGGMTAEVAFKKVATEISSQSVALAEELALTTAELSFLTDRRQAYDNLARRTGMEGVKAVCTALIQSERYGTPLGQTLRVLAQENRDMRMAAAEKKAAGLPPKLTVPMIMFFLPVLFVVILMPAYIRYQKDQMTQQVEDLSKPKP